MGSVLHSSIARMTWSARSRASASRRRVHSRSRSRARTVSRSASPPAAAGTAHPTAATRRTTELTTHNALYTSLDLPGFARHVLGLRASGLHRRGGGATPSSIGGASGILIAAPVDIDLGPGTLLLPVRGFARGVRAGTSAWTATAEYRFPIAAVGRG